MAGCRRGLAIAIALIHVARGVDDAFAKKATLTSIDGYPKPTCMCRTTLDGDLEEVLEALLDGESHRHWVSRLEESVVVAPRTSTVADAPVEELVYYRFALPFPAWDRQVSAALFCDRLGEGRARVELRRVSLPDSALPPPPGAGGGAPLPRTPEGFGAAAPPRAPSSERSKIARGTDALRAALAERCVAGLDRATALAPPGLRKGLAGLRPPSAAPMSPTLEAELHSRKNCVTLPAFRVTYLLDAAAVAEGEAAKTEVELILGADPGIRCPPVLLNWGLCHADRTLEMLQGQIDEKREARAAREAAEAPPGRDWPFRLEQNPLVLASKRARAEAGSLLDRLKLPQLPRPPRLFPGPGKGAGAPFPVTPASMRGG